VKYDALLISDIISNYKDLEAIVIAASLVLAKRRYFILYIKLLKFTYC
jgi:hypothetical protein